VSESSPDSYLTFVLMEAFEGHDLNCVALQWLFYIRRLVAP